MLNIRFEVRRQDSLDYLGAACSEISTLIGQFINLTSDFMVN